MFQNSTSKKNIFLILLKKIKKISLQYNSYLLIYRKSLEGNFKQLLFRLLESKSKFILLVFETFQEYYNLIQLWNIEKYYLRLKNEIFRNLTSIKRKEINFEIDILELEELNIAFVKEMLRKISEPSFRSLLLRHQFELRSIVSTA